MDCQDRPWRSIGWDGIRLQVPADWHPAAVYTNYLLFEEQHQPVCALKWQQIRGDFDPSRILKKLQKSLGQVELAPWQIPPPWQPHLKPFIEQGFRWHGSGVGGTGLLLYNRESRRLLLLQFYGEKNGQALVFEHLLAGLQDQQQKEKQLWSVFDICIHLPRQAQLTEHEFLPGSFRLHFTLLTHNLTFYRFKPAAELLRQQSLSDFGHKIAKNTPLERLEEPLLVQWHQEAGPGLHLLARLRKKPVCSTTRLWQIPEENVILGLKVQGNRKMLEPQFEILCSEYFPC